MSSLSDLYNSVTFTPPVVQWEHYEDLIAKGNAAVCADAKLENDFSSDITKRVRLQKANLDCFLAKITALVNEAVEKFKMDHFQKQEFIFQVNLLRAIQLVRPREYYAIFLDEMRKIKPLVRSTPLFFGSVSTFSYYCQVQAPYLKERDENIGPHCKEVAAKMRKEIEEEQAKKRAEDYRNCTEVVLINRILELREKLLKLEKQKEGKQPLEDQDKERVILGRLHEMSRPEIAQAYEDCQKAILDKMIENKMKDIFEGIED